MTRQGNSEVMIRPGHSGSIWNPVLIRFPLMISSYSRYMKFNKILVIHYVEELKEDYCIYQFIHACIYPPTLRCTNAHKVNVRN